MKEENVWEEEIRVNPAQMAFMLMQARQKTLIWSRGTGKSFIVGAEVDENVRLMPRGITTLAQATYGQALTKTLPSTFKMLEMLGYKKYDPKTGKNKLSHSVLEPKPEGYGERPERRPRPERPERPERGNRQGGGNNRQGGGNRQAGNRPAGKVRRNDFRDPLDREPRDFNDSLEREDF